MPVLSLRCRLFLYFLAIFFVILALVQVIMEMFSRTLEMALYTMAAVTFFPSIYYLAKDMLILYGVREKVKERIRSNPVTCRMAEDYKYRTLMFAIPGLALNIVFALFNGAVGLYHGSAWYGTLSAYYILLSIMRFLAVRRGRKLAEKETGEALLADEISIYHKCGILFLVLAVVLGGMVLLMVNEEGGKSYLGFFIYAVAAYTFYKVILSVVNLVKARKSNSPLLMAVRDIGHIDACVSVLSLQTAMFASFGNGQEGFMKMMNCITGIAVTLLVLCIGIYSVCSASQRKKGSVK